MFEPSYAARAQASVIREVVAALRPAGALALITSAGVRQEGVGLAEFERMIGGDDWWLGDVALLVRSAGGAKAVLYPGGDGTYLEVLMWGADSEGVRERLAPTLAGFGSEEI